jgi:peptidoglycan/xylan/chitin deacetylase (PgdA/CDA1 family)
MRSRFVNSALILGYHRVAETEQDPFDMCVTPQHFEEQLQVLRKLAQPIRLHELVEGLKENRLPRRAVVLTFDDGYADILYYAKPLLDRYQIPATIFVTSGYLGREFWWDELAWMIVNSQSMPDELSLIVDGKIFAWSISDQDRPKLLRNIYRRLLHMSTGSRRQAITQLRQCIGVDAGQEMNVGRALTHEELTELAKDELVTIGAHTVNHPVLTNLSEETRHYEIEQCKRDLETILQKPITAFSYPNGAGNEITQTLLYQAGYDSACASYNDVAHMDSDLFNLPRFWVPDQGGNEFTRWLSRWL